MNLQQQIKRIAVVRSLPGLGDFLCAIPAWRALRATFPNAQITLIGLPVTQNLVNRFSPYIDDWVEFPGFPGIPEGWKSPQKVVSFLTSMQGQFDLALQMHGSGVISNAFTVLLGSSITAGFYPLGQYCPDPQWFLPYPETEPEVRRHLQLMEFLGIPLQGEFLEFPLLEEDWEELRKIPQLPKEYVCLHPGASTSDRTFSPKGFAEIGDNIAQLGFPVILTGTLEEMNLTQTVQKMMKFPAINLAGCTSLGALAALLKKASLLICNDTGVSHLAAALGVKSVAIFSNSDPQRWSPLNRQRHRIVAGKEITTQAIAHSISLLQLQEAYAR